MSQRERVEASRPLRIVHVITRLLNGGADENTVLSCNYAATAGHDVTLIHGVDTHTEILAKLDPRVRVVSLGSLVRPIAPLNDAKALRGLVRAFRELDPDVVHTHTSKAGILGRLAARVVRTPAIVHGVHIVPFVNVGRVEGIVYRLAERAVARMTAAFVNVSSATRDLCLDARIGTAAQHHVIRSGFDVSRFRRAAPPAEWRELLRLRETEPRPPVLLMVAAFEERKRHLEFLQVFPRVVARFPDVRLILAGDGKLRAEIERQIEAHHLDDNVILTGFTDRPEELIALADVCVLASAREGLPRAVVQYVAGGRAAAATDLPGLHEVLRDDVNGRVVGPYDLDGLAGAIVDLLEDDAQRLRLARAAAETDLAAWDARRMVQGIEEIYRAVIAEGRPRSSRSRREAAESVPTIAGMR
jgi:glycosyltransferase involved in cell wall biosynthesis